MQLLRSASILATLVIFLNANIQYTQALRILGLFPLHVKSHFVMCEELMRGLAAKGHRVDVYSHFPLSEPMKNYHDYSLAGLIPPMVNSITYASPILFQSVEGMMKLWFEHDQEIVCNLMSSSPIQNLLHNPPVYDLIITEFSIVYCYIPFGRHLKAPVVGVVTSPLYDYQHAAFGTPKTLALQSSMYSPRSSAYIRSMGFYDRLINYLNYKRAIRDFTEVTVPQQKYVREYFEDNLPSIIDLLKDVSLVLVNNNDAIQGFEIIAPKVKSVGGLHIVDRNESLPEVVQKWLDDSMDGCVYFTFGSMIRLETFPKNILRAWYASFENIKPVRVLLKVVNGDELPPGLPSNVLTQPWFQQIAVLKHRNLKAFITHGGMSGSQEAIYYGVPMIMVPLCGDQFFNAMQFDADKVAIAFDLTNITERSFTHALNEILYNPLYRISMQRKSERFRDHPLPPLETAIYWIEYIHRHGKDALKSSLEDIPWWQASLLDVYAFLLGCILVALYVCLKLFYYLKSCVTKFRRGRFKYKREKQPIGLSSNVSRRKKMRLRLCN